MSEAERRVVLLARAGVACERLRGALAEAGANLVLEGDPTVLDPQALDAADPDVVVVVLDPASEDALDRFENLLLDPSIEVIFEEAELAASREGWDAARWARHLSAKLNRHDDVLPPGREPEPEPDPMLIAEGFVRPATLEQELPSSQAPGSIFGFAEAAPTSVPTQEVAEELVAADADDGIEEIEAIEAGETIEVIEAGEAFVAEDGFQAEPAAPSQSFDAGDRKSVV